MAQKQSDFSNDRGAAASLIPSQQQEAELKINGMFHHFLLQVCGGQLCPNKIPVNRMKRVLDLGCGSGEWVLELARRYPRLQIFGLDSDEYALQQAEIRRNIGNLRMTSFRKFDLTQPLPVPDDYLDFVHMQRRGRLIKPENWPKFVAECVRILQPRGWLALLELEVCEVSSPAFMKLYGALTQIYCLSGRSLDKTGTTIGMASHLYSLLLEAGLEEVSYDLAVMDLGFMGGSFARSVLMDLLPLLMLFKPMLVNSGLLAADEFDTLIEQFKIEVQARDLCGWGLVVTAYGRKGKPEPR